MFGETPKIARVLKGAAIKAAASHARNLVHDLSPPSCARGSGILDLIFSRLVTSLMTMLSRNAPVAGILAMFMTMVIRVIHTDFAEIAAPASNRNRLGISSF